MRLAFERRQRASSTTEVIEVVTPRTNLAALTSAENFLAAMALTEPFALEVAADEHRRQFLVRASTPRVSDRIQSQLGAAYPQAELRAVHPSADPATCRPGELAASCTLALRAAPYLPIRTFVDLDVDGERAAQADPVLGLLSAFGDLPPGWRCLSQLVLEPLAESWSRSYTRLSVQHPLERERIVQPGGSAVGMLTFTSLVLALAVVGLQVVAWTRNGQWLQSVALVMGALAGGAMAVYGARRLARTTVYDMDLVRDKVVRIAFRAELRLTVFAPAATDHRALRAHLLGLAAAYRRYNLAAANGFEPRVVRTTAVPVSTCAPIGGRRKQPILTTREIAGLWHLPHAAADVPLLERTTARRWLPLPSSVAEGCRIGVSVHQGHSVAVAVPPDVLRRHALLVAKTRRGKSTLMLRLARFAMQALPRTGVVLVDPHADLATTALGLVPSERAQDVVFLDVADREHPFGLNLLDVGLGWDRDRAVANSLAVFQREWGDRFWGPRMEDAFRFALLSLLEANMKLCTADPVSGRAAQHTLLEVPTMLSDVAFRREVLTSVTDPAVRTWWSDYFEPLDRRLQQEIVNPILSKIHRFEGSRAARQIVGQPASTIDPGAWVREGKIVIVNTARGVVGENAAALIGSTLLNLVTLAIAEQARLSVDHRSRVTIFVDEFHTIPGADYEAILAELAKYGANLVLASQSLARLIALDREAGNGLRAMVFANLDALYAFNCSAEDAEYLVPELGGAVDPQDLVELSEHHCYARLSTAGQRLPTFSVKLDPPLAGDMELADALRRTSRLRYGRSAEDVGADRQSALARVLQARAQALIQPAPAPAVADSVPAARHRNEHRQRKKRRLTDADVAAGA